MPETLLESEVFGHVKGAFSGAISSRRGLFETADGGTLFLDEIGEMSAALQAKLLTVLETGRFRAVGDTRERSADVRLVTATHRDLRAATFERTFREDLLFRLNVVSLEVPPLRYRRNDVPLLLEHFLAQALVRRPNATVRRFAPDAMKALLEYQWPGNVRELAHLVERVVVLGQHEAVGKDELPGALLNPLPAAGSLQFSGGVLRMRELQRQYAAWALAQHGGHKRETCEALDLDLKTLNRLLPGEEVSIAEQH
jgi:two-component system response regulator HydG